MSCSGQRTGDRIVVGLGGNALLRRGETPDASVQLNHIRQAAPGLAKVANGNELVIVHGNGPQVGMLALEREDDAALTTTYPLDALVAETQGLLGYWLQQALANAGLRGRIATVVTQTVVDENDPAFQSPEKVIGRVCTKDEAERPTSDPNRRVNPNRRVRKSRIRQSPVRSGPMPLSGLRDREDNHVMKPSSVQTERPRANTMKDECTVEVPVPNSTMEVLGEAECRALLGNESVGRLAYISENAPMIAPVDFMMFDELIVFRSDPGDKLSHVPLQQVCFEADGSDGIDRVWSVVVHGHARDVTTALNEQYEQIRQRQLPTFATLADPHWVAIEVDQISGRRLAR